MPQRAETKATGGGRLSPLLANLGVPDAATDLEVFDRPRTAEDRFPEQLADRVRTVGRSISALAPTAEKGPGEPLFDAARRTIVPDSAGEGAVYLIPTERNWVVIVGEDVEPLFIKTLPHDVMWDIDYVVSDGRKIPKTIAAVTSNRVRSVSLIRGNGERLLTKEPIGNTVFGHIPPSTDLDDLKKLEVTRRDGSIEIVRIQA